jgi:DNA polymerase-1
VREIYSKALNGDDTSVVLYESDEDFDVFKRWIIELCDDPVAVDVEATGLDQRAPDWEVRTVQFGDPFIGWVIPAEFRDAIQFGLTHLAFQIAHNRPYDATALEVAGFTHGLWSGADTMIMAHVIDSRGRHDGGTGHGLKALSDHWIEESASDSEVVLKQWAKDNKVKLDDRFRLAPIDVLAPYAGMDVILTARLFHLFSGELAGDELPAEEFQIQRACHRMASKGMRIDEPYARALVDYFKDEEANLLADIQDLGVDNPSSPKQVVESLLADGVELSETTASGAPSVAADVLAYVDHPLAKRITAYRQAKKFRVTYVEKCLDLAVDGRVHPSIRSLQARTARMAISNPPLQQLPAGDALIRRMFIADDGMLICAADFSQVELRVLAALADEEAMLSAIANGTDLHTNTAELVGISRKVAKMTNFLIVYGGGAKALAKQADIPALDAKEAIAGFGVAFPSIAKYGTRLQERSGFGRRPVVTPSGRKLRLDKDRTYAAVNYVVQSAARDVLANAIMSVDASEYGDSMLVPVHDEIVFQAPVESAVADSHAVARLMETEFLGKVFLAAEGEVHGPSWGHGYVDLSPIPTTLKEWF